VRLFIDPAQTHLGAEGHQGGAVGVGVRDPEEQVDGPGPRVARQTPAFPVTRPYMSAMKAAPCSERVRMKRIEVLLRASTRWMISSPGRPKI